MTRAILGVVLAGALAAGCAPPGSTGAGGQAGALLKDDLAFLKQHTDVVVLATPDGSAQVVVCPKLQGRVATSTAGGPTGPSLGWINRSAIASGTNNRHFNAYGGEDRLWLGPEGGQFSIYFKKGDPFDLDHWWTPPPFNEEPFEVVSQRDDRVVLAKKMHLENYSGTAFDLEIQREIALLGALDVQKYFGLPQPADVKLVAYESRNELKNAGAQPWKKETGLLSVWILGMFNATPSTTVAVPFEAGDAAARGPIVNDTYFGKVPSDRLKEVGSVLFFKADAKYRSKIGVSRKRVKNVLGSYDAVNKVLTLVQFNLPSDATDYVNSMWEIQKEPYAGDVANAYTDGPPKPGAPQMGQFYEMETSSPAAALAPGETLTHLHRTFHFQGGEPGLNRIAKAVLGVSVAEMRQAFK